MIDMRAPLLPLLTVWQRLPSLFTCATGAHTSKLLTEYACIVDLNECFGLARAQQCWYCGDHAVMRARRRYFMG